MMLRPSVAVTDVTVDVIAPALTKCEIVVQYNTFSNHWLFRRGLLECWLIHREWVICLNMSENCQQGH